MKFNTDRILGLSAMMISLLTLIIFIYQTNLMRTQSRLSVTPRLSFQTNQKHTDSVIIYSVAITNKGLGPAIVESIKILHEDRDYDLDFPEFFTQAYPDIGKYGELLNNMTMGKGSTLAPGESNILYTFSTRLSRAEELLQYLNVKNDEMPFRIEVVYSSIYKEQWRVRDDDSGHPLRL